jgi:FtsP/CotA-like multicopper oxidase with cupredoxin domain
VPIVPESAYASAYASMTVDTYSRIASTSIDFVAPSTTTTVTQGLEPKAIQELFELNYGRMNATLGVELPFTNFNTQTTIPLGYVDPLTENVANGETQIWKITHNGVDTHSIHFHLWNVQVINRVGWDGAIRPPDANELGWKETVRMNPLEDIIVALRPVAPTVPFPISDSVRPPDPTMPTTATLTVTNPADGNPLSLVNTPISFGWEYVWHCHLLGHEENDMMRPISFNGNAVELPPLGGGNGGVTPPH